MLWDRLNRDLKADRARTKRFRAVWTCFPITSPPEGLLDANSIGHEHEQVGWFCPVGR